MKKMCLLAACLFLLAALLPTGALGEVVDNGSDPASRLNMRSEPSRDANSLGRFYSGTQVQVMADAGDGWAQVCIGGGQNSLSGYMMSQYLSYSSSVDATYTMLVSSPYGTQSVVLRSKPSNSYEAVAMLEVGQSVRVIGTAGDYYYVQLGDGSVGCLSGNELN